MTDDLRFTIADHIATIVIDRPHKLNAMTPAMADALVAAVAECNTSDDVRCVVVTGAGEKAFSAGSDISTLGGTGIAVSRRAEVTPELLDHLRWLLSDEAQRGFIPQHQGQPSFRSAWTDPSVDAAADGFYAATGATLEAALVRPRHNGAIAFQTEASALLRTALLAGTPADPVLDAVEAAYRHHHPAGAQT